MIAAKNYAALRDMNEIIRTDLLKSIHAHQSQDERRKQIITDVDVLQQFDAPQALFFALCKIGLVRELSGKSASCSSRPAQPRISASGCARHG